MSEAHSDYLMFGRGTRLTRTRRPRSSVGTPAQGVRCPLCEQTSALHVVVGLVLLAEPDRLRRVLGTSFKGQSAL